MYTNKSKGKIIIIILLLLIIIGLGGYILYDKFNVNDNNTKNNTTKNVVTNDKKVADDKKVTSNKTEESNYGKVPTISNYFPIKSNVKEYYEGTSDYPVMDSKSEIVSIVLFENGEFYIKSTITNDTYVVGYYVEEKTAYILHQIYATGLNNSFSKSNGESETYYAIVKNDNGTYAIDHGLNSNSISLTKSANYDRASIQSFENYTINN